MIVLLVGSFFAYVAVDEPYQEWKYRLDENNPKTLALFNSVKLGDNFLEVIFPNGSLRSDFKSANLEAAISTPSAIVTQNSGTLIPRTKDGEEAVDKSKSYIAYKYGEKWRSKLIWLNCAPNPHCPLKWTARHR